MTFALVLGLLSLLDLVFSRVNLISVLTPDGRLRQYEDSFLAAMAWYN